MYALVDCNNFYVSCERLFQPALEGRPVVVLSNNDGCAISISEEAKKLGIEMGTPAFMIDALIKKHDVKVFSSNYTLYHDISERVMTTMATFVPALEIYSIDEAFLDMHELAYQDLLKLGIEIRKAVKQNVGIPVSIGIAPTRTLAKMANRYAKKKMREIGVHWAANKELISEILACTDVENICGVGRQYSLLLQKHGLFNALDLINAPEEWVRKNMTVQGQRIYNELKGTESFKWEFETSAKKNICTSRAFGALLTDRLLIREALCNYAANCALKLRQQKSCCKKVHVFLQTNPHRREDQQYFRSITIELEAATNITGDLIKYACKALDIIFQAGYKFMKCGIIVMDLVPQQVTQTNIFINTDRKKSNKVMDTIDKVNKSLGKEIVRFAVQGFEKKYKVRAEYLSPRYTTKISDILKVKN